MSFADERLAVEHRFKAQWGSRTKVKYENVEFKQPKEDDWVALTVVSASGAKISLGENGYHRFGGTIIVQVFTKEDGGTVSARGHADVVATIFQDKEFQEGSSGLIRCRTPNLVRVGENNGWYQFNVSVPYIRDET